MTPEPQNLRTLSVLEQKFYQELLSPLNSFAATRLEDPELQRQLISLVQRFTKNFARYGYVSTSHGALMQVSPDPLNEVLTPDEWIAARADMRILRRLTSRP
jgi:hypothetical protein